LKKQNDNKSQQREPTEEDKQTQNTNSQNNTNNENAKLNDARNQDAVKPTKASTQAFYAYQVGTCYLMLRKWDLVSRYMHAVSLLLHPNERPIEVFAKRKAAQWCTWLSTMDMKDEDTSKKLSAWGILDTTELMLTWNSFQQMAEAPLKQCLQLLRDANQQSGQFWSLEDQMRYELLCGGMLRSLEKYDEALFCLNKVMQQEAFLRKSTKATLDGVLPFAYHEISCIRLALLQFKEAKAALAKANDFSSYDLYKTLQVRLYSLTSTIQREETKRTVQ